MVKRTARLHVRAHGDQMERWKRCAELSGRTLSEFVSAAVDKECARVEREARAKAKDRED